MRMHDLLLHRVKQHLPLLASLYYRLLLVVGPARSGKTTALRRLADDRSWPLINVNLSLSGRLLGLTSRQRPFEVSRLLDRLADEYPGDVLLLDNTEILFSPVLQQDPLRLLQGLARNRTVIATWAGDYDGNGLTYAVPAHSEFRRYDNPEVAIVPTVGA